MVGENLSTVVTGVKCMTKVLKIVVLFIKLGWIDMYLLDNTSEVILLSDNLVSCFELSQLTHSLFIFKFTHIYFRS